MTAGTGFRAAVPPSMPPRPRTWPGASQYAVVPPEEFLKRLDRDSTEPDDGMRATRIWDLLHRGTLDLDKARREQDYIKARLPLCDSCQLFSGQIRYEGYRLCGGCYNDGLLWRLEKEQFGV